jgi:hypothetical protein
LREEIRVFQKNIHTYSVTSVRPCLIEENKRNEEYR